MVYPVVVLNPVTNDGYGNPIGSSYDQDVGSHRLLVNPGTVSVSVGPQVSGDPTNIVSDFVKNNGSPDLLVNGQQSPVIFTFDADSLKDIEIQQIRAGVSAPDIIFDGDSFAGSGSLSNGVLVELFVDGQAYEINNISINEDWLFFSNSGGGLLLNNTGPKDVMSAVFNFKPNCILKAGSSDKIRVTVRDRLNLGGSNALSYFQIKVFGIFEV
jgi:hypothetical protein